MPDDANGATPDPHILTALRLRQLAEKASGLRDEALVLAFEKKQRMGWDLVSRETAKELDGPKIDVNPQPGRRPGRLRSQWGKVDSVTVQYHDRDRRHEVDLAPKCDAFFWSPAAIEKFVLTYYLPLLPYEQWLALYLRVQGVVAGDTLYGIAHTYPSIPEYLTAGFTYFLTAKGTVAEQEFIIESLGLFKQQFAML